MKNNKGFTLIELIATIAIMLLIFSIAIPTMLGASEKKKKDQCEAYAEQFKTVAELAVSDHKNDVIKCYNGDSSNMFECLENKKASISLQELYDNDYLDKIPINPITDNEFNSDSSVSIKINNANAGTDSNPVYTFTYEYTGCDN